jgi:hypothetical protein
MSGAIPVIYCPSEGLLNVDLDVTGLFSGSEYMSWKESVEDVLNEIDKAYAKRSSMVKGRRIKAYYKTVTTEYGKQRVRVVSVSPYPSRFTSILSALRTEIYGSKAKLGILPKYGEVIAEIYRSVQPVKLYLVPSSNLSKLNDEIDRLNRIVDNLQLEIAAYENSFDFDKVIGRLKVVPVERWNKYPVKAQLYHIRVQHIPFIVSDEIINSYMDERTKAAVEQTVKAAVQTVAKDIQGKIKKIIEEYFSLLSKKYNAWDIKRLRTWTEQIKSLPEGQKWFSREIQAIESMIDAIEEKDEDKMLNAIYNIASVMEVPTEGRSPSDVFKGITDRLTSTLSPSIKSLIDSL